MQYIFNLSTFLGGNMMFTHLQMHNHSLDVSSRNIFFRLFYVGLM